MGSSICLKASKKFLHSNFTNYSNACILYLISTFSSTADNSSAFIAQTKSGLLRLLRWLLRPSLLNKFTLIASFFNFRKLVT